MDQTPSMPPTEERFEISESWFCPAHLLKDGVWKQMIWDADVLAILIRKPTGTDTAWRLDTLKFTILDREKFYNLIEKLKSHCDLLAVHIATNGHFYFQGFTVDSGGYVLADILSPTTTFDNKDGYHLEFKCGVSYHQLKDPGNMWNMPEYIREFI